LSVEQLSTGYRSEVGGRLNASTYTQLKGGQAEIAAKVKELLQANQQPEEALEPAGSQIRWGTLCGYTPRQKKRRKIPKRHKTQNAPGAIRTRDLRFRKPTLYPAELRGLVDHSMAAI
jgi:hypothetical protein